MKSKPVGVKSFSQVPLL